eukprot:TRINITY_DN96_c0_g1_i9.p1 TRINITY_DN96_c0_g1~~TRINITY_DN96_c0_g1_i9.p1  ORF type:complete len:112 (+),score=28.36 TRINITY_DN96_c0_g1_i9:168-503(+)
MLSFHGLELVHLLQLGDLEGSVGLAGLHLQIGNLHVPLLHLVLSIKLLTEGDTGSVIEALAKSSEVILAHGRDIRKGSNLFKNSFRRHLNVFESTGELPMYSALIPLLTLR